MCEVPPEYGAAMDKRKIARFYHVVRESLYALQGSECRSTGTARW